jgi:hypothetical protein
MLEQIALALSLIACLLLTYRRLAPKRNGATCHQGRCGCGQAECAPPLARISPQQARRS